MKKIYSYSLSAAFVAALLSVSSVANAQDNNAAVTAEASQDAAVATFEDLTLEPKSHWAGPADNAEEVSGAYVPFLLFQIPTVQYGRVCQLCKPSLGFLDGLFLQQHDRNLI